MKILKLSNKKFFFTFLVLIISFSSLAEDKPTDIWNVDQKKTNENSQTENIILEKEIQKKEISESNIYNMQSQKSKNDIEFDKELTSDEIKIIGLYDPEDNSLDIDMWLNSDGDQLRNIFKKIKKAEFSKDAKEIMNILILTNAHYPKKNISSEEFLKFKSDWLIKNFNLELIETYLIKNQIINSHPRLTKFLVDEHLSSANIDKVCDFFSKNLVPINDNYLSKLNIYCLVQNEKVDEAQLIYDLKKEQGFKDRYFENKIKYLFKINDKVDETISEQTIFDFYLAHQTISNFNFEPNENTKKIIWKYLSSANLLNSFQKIEISDLEKISLIEMATHERNFPEKDLFKIYKRFQFNINQLLNAEDFYKSLSNIEGRALIYQKILLESEKIDKLKLLKILKGSFKKDKLENAFDDELKKFLTTFEPTEIPDNLTSFYYTNIDLKKNQKKKIKYNNDILHQSKLINYFNGDFSKSKIEKDINNFLKRIKKNKKYQLSTKDLIFLESLKYDGINIDKKFDNLFEVNVTDIPTDIQVMINNNEKAAALLRLVEVIGQDKLERIDDETMYFIISTLNQLNINILRNKILLKVLPLKV